MKNIRSRKAFTLIELIIVIVILGILAGISIVGYQAVIDRANDSKVETGAQSYGRAVTAIAAFDNAAPTAFEYHDEMAADSSDLSPVLLTEDGTTPGFQAAEDVDVAVAGDVVSYVTFTDADGNTATLAVGTSVGDAGSVVK